jgi:hypothetical protein
MVVVVDSGSTKADWKLMDKHGSRGMSTMGFNPVFHTSDVIIDELTHAFDKEFAFDQVKEVYFYGSGCWDDQLKQKITTAMLHFFPQAHIEVEHDLLGAARSTCGTAAGISCIMGTGSNSCLYDGKDVTDNVTNLGYLLGDEGSGTHLGKKLIRAYFYRELPGDLHRQLEHMFPGGKQFILDNIYGPKTPNVFLASFTRFIHKHRRHPYFQRLIYESFSEFIDRHVRKYPRHLSLPIHFIGSIAFHFQESLVYILEERSMTVGNFIKKPIEKLAEFHLMNTLQS